MSTGFGNGEKKVAKSQTEVQALLVEYAAVEKKRARAILVRDDEAAPIFAKHDGRIEKLQNKSDELASEIIGYLDKQTKDVVIESSGAVAERKTQTKLMARVIDVKKFLAKAKSKGEAAYECLSVAVQKAEALLGVTALEAISHRPERREVVTTLKLK